MTTEKVKFDPDLIRASMEICRMPNGAFIASPTKDYSSIWIRDHLYCAYSYWYINEYDKLIKSVWLIFDLFKKYAEKFKRRISSPIDVAGGVIHTKYSPHTLEEITTDDGWGHDQLDIIGLFLHVVGDLDFKNIRVIRNKEDLEILQLLIFYLRSVEYWHRHDFGMWEECRLLHSSSIGACVGGLKYIRRQNFVVVDDSLIMSGEKAIRFLFPHESLPGKCGCDHCKRHARDHPQHSHDCDAAQFTLIWPYHVLTNPKDQDIIISRLIQGHSSEDGTYHKLLQKHGFNRYWGDDYYRSTEKYGWVSAEWSWFKFWISIIYSQRHEYDLAEHWFHAGCEEIKDNKIAEAFSDGEPNNHIPLAWAHAIALIAWSKLPDKTKLKFA